MGALEPHSFYTPWLQNSSGMPEWINISVLRAPALPTCDVLSGWSSGTKLGAKTLGKEERPDL